MRTFIRLANIISLVVVLLTMIYLACIGQSVSPLFFAPFFLYAIVGGYSTSMEIYHPTGNTLFNYFLILAGFMFLSGFVYLAQKAYLVENLFSGYVLFLGCGMVISIITIITCTRNIYLIKRQYLNSYNSNDAKLWKKRFLWYYWV